MDSCVGAMERRSREAIQLAADSPVVVGNAEAVVAVVVASYEAAVEAASEYNNRTDLAVDRVAGTAIHWRNSVVNRRDSPSDGEAESEA